MQNKLLEEKDKKKLSCAFLFLNVVTDTYLADISFLQCTPQTVFS